MRNMDQKTEEWIEDSERSRRLLQILLDILDAALWSSVSLIIDRLLNLLGSGVKLSELQRTSGAHRGSGV